MSSYSVCFLSFLLPMLCTLTTSAGEPSRAADSSINAYYINTTADRWMDIFESQGREIYDRRRGILEAVGVRPGMAIADIGAGTGLFTMLFAEAVGADGKVYAVDISKGFIDAIEQRAEQAGLRNVTAVLNTQQDTGLAPASIDLAFVCDTYHHFEHPNAMLASIYQALRPGGVLIIIDFRRIPGRSNRWVLSHVRAGREAVINEVQRAGFELLPSAFSLRSNYLLQFLKK